ncbi:MAG: methyltransferase domain-containing protein [Lapillicoccus sp.]
MQRPPRYGWVAPFYDLVSVEWPVYRAGRVAGVEALGLRPGDTVADVGCGTGLSLSLLRKAVGAHGGIVGVDASPTMLRQAAGRIASAGWGNVDLVRADAAEPGALAMALQSAEGSDGEAPPLDGAIFVYSLSLMSSWPQVGPRSWR